MEMGPEERDSTLLDIAECSTELGSRDSIDNDKHNESLTVDSQRLSSGPSPDLSEVSSVSQEDSKMSIRGSDAVEKEAEPVGESSESHAVLERRHSYQMATDDEVLDSPAKTPDTKGQGKLTAGDTIKRSTSSVENSSQAAIKLRKSLELSRSPRAVSTSVYSGSLYQSALERLSSSSANDSAYFSLNTTCLDQMIDREVNTSPYPTPLIGCIPPSALKCFVEKKEAGTSPAHSHSGWLMLYENHDPLPVFGCVW